MSFQSLLHDEVVSIIATLTKASKALIAALLPLLQSNLSTLVANTLPLAVEAATAQMTSGASGSAKRDAAISQIKAAALAAGVETTSQAISIAVELAVASLPKTQAQSGIVTPNQAVS